VLDVFPRFQFNGPGVDRLDSATNFQLPIRFGFGVGGSVQARKDLDGQFGTFIRAEAQSIGEHGFDCSSHAGNSTSSNAAEQPDQPVGRSGHAPCARKARTLSARVSQHDELNLPGFGQTSVRMILPWLAVISFSALLGLATTLVGALAVDNFYILPADVGQPPWQPSSGINAAIVLLATVFLWGSVAVFLRNKNHLAFVVALAATAIELGVIPFLHPIWTELQ
jgi:hypothetical protein